MEKSAIVLTSDLNYLPYASILCNKLRKLGFSREIFFLYDGNVSDCEQFNLELQRVEIISIQDELNKIQGLKSSGYISRTTYGKFLIPDLVPAYLERILYVDTDMLIRRNPENLLDRRMRNIIAAVPELHTNGRDLFGTYDETYFNAGLLMIDINKWRQNRILEKFKERFKELGNLQFLDQNYFNIIFRQEWDLLPLSANVFADINSEEPSIRGLHDPLIVHFTGSQKPWNTKSNLRFFREWQSDAIEFGFKLENFQHRNYAFRGYLQDFRNSKIGKILRQLLPVKLKRLIWRIFNLVLN